MKNFNAILAELKKLKNSAINNCEYAVPSLWITSGDAPKTFRPIDYFISQFENIVSSQTTPTKEKPLSDAIIYNMMPRYTTAFDHFPENSSVHYTDFNHAGSLLKTIALLPYLKSIGTDILYFLPLFAIGKQSPKGNLGSVYSIRNAYKFDENLAEPFLKTDLEIQFKALVEAAHLLGIKVVTEFIFRTAATDSDLIPKHPDWFYWIKEADYENFRAPEFQPDTLSEIKQKVKNKDFSELHTPSKEYIAQFSTPPESVIYDGNKYVGITKSGERVVVPSAFADWPPDDNQPVWSDVTYFNMYSDTHFNYMAYNTIRMYDNKLRTGGTLRRDLRDYILGIVPDYIREYGIDGIMLDMGHALPEEIRTGIITEARKCKPDFLLFEENFIPSETSKADGFNAVVGYLPFDFACCDKMRGFAYRIAESDLPILSFATAENHNTKRTQSYFRNPKFSEMIWSISSFLPRTVRFIHSGFELLQVNPVNTGLEFSDEEIAEFPAEKLPLFSFAKMKWEHTICKHIHRTNALRAQLPGTIEDYSLALLDPQNDNILAYTLNRDNLHILVVANFSSCNEKCEINLPFESKKLLNSVSSVNFVDGINSLQFELTGFDCIIEFLQS